MKIHGALTPIMHEIFQSDPNITTGEAVATLRERLSDLDDVERHEEEAIALGLTSLWGDFTGKLRREAQKVISAASSASRQLPLNLGIFETMKLATPDGDLSPTYADSTAAMFHSSIAYMQKQIDGLGNQIALSRKLACLLESAEETTGDPDLTLRNAFARGLITAEMMEAA